jgi:hypothetical protein
VGGSGIGDDPWAQFATPSSSSSYPSSGYSSDYPSSANGHGESGGLDGDDRALADVARRLYDRIDAHETQLNRAADLAQWSDDRARLAEVREAARRLRRDSETLLLLSGADPGVRSGIPDTVSVVLGDAVAVVEEPAHVSLRSTPSATLTAGAATELRHLVAELIDEATAASPGARIEVGTRWDRDGALAIEVIVAARGWSDGFGGVSRNAFGGGGLFRVAERLARCSRVGIRLDRPLVDDVPGVVATVHCPAAQVTGGRQADPWRVPTPARGTATPSSAFGGRAASGGSGGDELFGPLPSSVAAIGTPIFEAVASAWFRDDRPPEGDEWSTPGDREWRAAAARATRTDIPPPTASGLPRRNPGDRLVPPPLSASRPSAPPDERVPERVRDRLATYQRGLRQGRHRAAEDEPEEREHYLPERDSWTPEPDSWRRDGW